jgi:signal transduction histidine kinase/ActR/RegA family two-component response regulator
MPSFKNLSINGKLTLVITLASSTTLLLATAGYVSYQVGSFRSAAVRDTETLAQIAGDNGAAALAFGDARAAEQILSSLKAKSNIVSAAFYTRTGEVLARFRRDAAARAYTWPAPRPEGPRFERGHLVVVRPVILDGESIGIVCLDSDLREVVVLVRRYLVMVGLVCGLAVVFAWVLSHWLRRLVSRPILLLADAARAVSQDKNFTLRVPGKGNDELGRLTAAFNEMLAEIETRDAALRGAHDEMEKRVDERTAELRREVGDRQQAEEALRESEAQLRQAQKIEAIGRLAGGVAHDFNNILTAINGYAQLMIARLDPRDPLRKNAEEIQKAGARAAGLTRQLLAFSRKQVLAPKVLDLNAVVANLEPMLRRLIGEDVEFRFRPEADLGRVHADPGQVEQVIMNLVVNARDAMEAGGTISIETASVGVDASYAQQHLPMTPGPYVMVEVSDTGCGMDELTRSRIFEPFFTTKERGTGLGLSTVYGIVKQSGGYVWVYSEPGEGTTFKVYLPRVERAADVLDGPAAAEPLRGSETVLLVEDDELVRGLTLDVLELSGYTVLEAPHGGEAILICERHTGTIDIMVSDVVMPHLSGRQLLDRVRPLRPDMKVLFMSGYTAGAIEDRGVLSPGTNFIQKPFSPDDFARKVREVLDQPVHRAAASSSGGGGRRP